MVRVVRMPLIADIAKKIRIRIHRHLFDFGYDAHQAIETGTVLLPAQLHLVGENASHAMQYEPTPVKLFGYLLRRLARHFDFSQFVFVDIGSGKGRTLLLAAEGPFLRVEGVELAETLHRTALRNIRQVNSNGRRNAPIVLHSQDASTYCFPDTPLLIYLFNPFDAFVLDQFHSNLKRSLEENPRECVVLYVNSKHREVFDLSGSFEEVPRTFKEKLVEALLSPWPIAIYRWSKVDQAASLAASTSQSNCSAR